MEEESLEDTIIEITELALDLKNAFRVGMHRLSDSFSRLMISSNWKYYDHFDITIEDTNFKDSKATKTKTETLTQ